MMKTYLKKDNGITISILIITIVIMLILAGVAISAMVPEGVVNKAQMAKEDFNIKGEIEKVHNALDYKYYLNSGRELNEADEGIVESLAKIIKETGISPNKFVIYYDKLEGEIYKDLIFYRYDLVTDEEKEKIRNYREVTGMFIGDANLDGVLSNEDLKIVDKISEGTIDSEYYNENKELLLKLCDYNKDDEINSLDVAFLNAILRNTVSILKFYQGGK